MEALSLLSLSSSLLLSTTAGAENDIACGGGGCGDVAGDDEDISAIRSFQSAATGVPVDCSFSKNNDVIFRSCVGAREGIQKVTGELFLF